MPARPPSDVEADFLQNTRHKTHVLGAQAKAGGVAAELDFRLPNTGILQTINLGIRGTVAGTLSAPHAMGMSSIVANVALMLNTGLTVIKLTGWQYHYLARDFVDLYQDPVSSSNARSAVTAAAFNLDMVLPIAVNSRDIAGLLLLQSRELEAHLYVTFSADTFCATGATVTATVTPTLGLLTIPPGFSAIELATMLDTVHTIIGSTVAVPAVADQDIEWLKANSYLGCYMGMGYGVSGADQYSRALLYAGSTDAVYNYVPTGQDAYFQRAHGRARLPGTLIYDFMGSSGLGMYGSSRDVLHTGKITDLKTVLTPTATGVLDIVRNELQAVRG